MRSAPGSFATSAAATTVLLATAACDPTRAPIHTRHTDSAGIPIATAVTPLWGPGDGWTVEAEPLVEIGSVSGAPEYQFADVVAVVRLSNGDIVVADRGASELRSFDNEGVFIWSAGREGEGPGEFRSLEFLGAKAGDSLVAYDAALLPSKPASRASRAWQPSPVRRWTKPTSSDRCGVTTPDPRLFRSFARSTWTPVGISGWPRTTWPGPTTSSASGPTNWTCSRCGCTVCGNEEPWRCHHVPWPRDALACLSGHRRLSVRRVARRGEQDDRIGRHDHDPKNGGGRPGRRAGRNLGAALIARILSDGEFGALVHARLEEHGVGGEFAAIYGNGDSGGEGGTLSQAEDHLGRTWRGKIVVVRALQCCAQLKRCAGIVTHVDHNDLLKTGERRVRQLDDSVLL